MGFKKIALLLASVFYIQACESSLKAPAGYYQPVKPPKVGQYNCLPIPTPFTEPLIFPSKYEGDGKSRSNVNKKAYQKYLDGVANTRALEKTAQRYGKKFINGYPQQARSCYMDTLEAWARSDALLHTEANAVGQAVRKWTLASIVSVYLQMQTLNSGLSEMEPLQQQKVESWFYQVAQQTKAFYSDREPRKINNHDYWAAYAVLLCAVVLDDQRLFDWSMSKFREGIDRVGDDGFMAHEIGRGALALKYQNFAIQPLVMIAAFAKANDASDRESIAKLRLAIDTLSEGITRPEIFEAKADIAQDTKDIKAGWSLAWVPVWKSSFGSKGSLDNMSQGPFNSMRLGGDMAWLFATAPDK